MPRITEDLVRRRAEHNNCEIATLEEISLHQQDIERIEHLDRWCKGLKILYLQNNLISRIENVGRLKELQYLNLALNNIERIENLRGCESLEKLDLTVNFVGELLSVESLQCNQHLNELYLTGNPCTEFEGYREFVVATLPGLQRLDGREIARSERILATQRYDEVRRRIVEQQKQHQMKRERERCDHESRQRPKEQRPGFDGRWYTDPKAHLAAGGGTGVCVEEGGGGRDTLSEARDREVEEDEEEEEERFWKEPSAYTPESRAETHAHMAKRMAEKAKETRGPDQSKRVRRLERDGKMLNINEGRYDFHLEDDMENGRYILEIDCPRFMATSIVECDVQPTYVRVTLKGKVFQLVLQEEVSPHESSAHRSKTTGRLLVTIPKASPVIRAKQKTTPTSCSRTTQSVPEHKIAGNGVVAREMKVMPSFSDGSKEYRIAAETLEVDPSLLSLPDLANIVPDDRKDQPARCHAPSQAPLTLVSEVPQSHTDFVDDPDVPPLV